MDIVCAMSLHPCHPSGSRGVLFLLLSFLFCSVTVAGTRLSGEVRDAASHRPIAQALVTLTSGYSSAITGNDGRFNLRIPDAGTVHLHVRRAGYHEWAGNVARPDSTLCVVELHEVLYPVDPVVTTALRTGSASERVPATIETVSADALCVRTANDAGELLAHIPGTLTRSYGGIGDVRTISLRGSASNQVLVLIDGVRLNAAQSGEVDLSTIPLESVQRIEVVRGGASAEYGADAVGGVVNIITRKESDATGLHTMLRADLGSFGSRGGGGRMEWNNGEAFGSVSYQFHQHDNRYPFLDATGTTKTRENADVRSQVVDAEGRMRVGDAGGTASLHVQYFFQNAGDPGSINDPYPHARKTNRNLELTGTWTQSLAGSFLRGQAYVNRLQFSYDNPDGVVITANDSRNIAFGAELNDRLEVAPWCNATLGADLRRDTYNGNALDVSHKRTLVGTYVQGHMGPPAEGDSTLWFSVVPAMRWDDFSDFGSRFSPKLGVVAAAGGVMRITLKSTAGLSFRAPTFNDLYWPRDNFSVGNPNLAAETATESDAGLQLRLNTSPGGMAGITYFHNDVKDLILWEAGAGGVWMPSNLGRAVLEGLETEMRAGPFLHAVECEWSYTRLHAIDRSGRTNEDGKQLPYRPEHRHAVSVHLLYGALEMSGTIEYLSRRYTTASNTTSLPAVRTLDLSAAYTVPTAVGSVTGILSCRNLTGVQYQMIESYPVPGRELRFSLRWEGGAAVN